MQTNFTIEGNSAIQFQGRHIDLHNCFDFDELVENYEKKELIIKFKKAEGSWVKKDELDAVTFHLLDVFFLHKSTNATDLLLEDSRTLEFLSFFSSELRELNDCLVQQEKPKEGDDLLFHFFNGNVIRAACDRVVVEVETTLQG